LNSVHAGKVIAVIALAIIGGMIFSNFAYSETFDMVLVTVNVVSSNNPPVLEPIGGQEGNENQTFVIPKIVAMDPDNDTLTITADNLPSGARFFQVTSQPGYVEYKLSWPDRFVIPGVYSVTFTASDGQLTDSETITITIHSLNDAPELYPIGNQHGTEGTLFAIKAIKASDPDGDMLTLTAENLPAGARFFQVASRPGYIEYKLRWLDRFVKPGVYNVTFTVSDGKLTDSEAITITIDDVNLPPRLNPIGNQQGKEGETFVIKAITATDNDGDALTITAVNLPAGARFFQESSEPGYVVYKLRWLDKFVKVGRYAVTFTASDGQLTNSETITIIIKSPGDFPTCSINASVIEGEAPLKVDFEAVASGPVPIRKYWWDFDDGTTATDVTSISHTFNPSSLYTVRLTIRDKDGITASAAPVLITVQKPLHAVSIDAAPETGIAPLQIDFKTIYNPIWTPGCVWNLGDGTQAVGPVTTHIYDTPGDYNVTLQASDSNYVSEAAASIRVFNDAQPSNLGDRAIFVWYAWDAGGSEGWKPQGDLGNFDIIGDGFINTALKNSDSSMESPRLIIDTSILKKVSISYKIIDTDFNEAKFVWKKVGDTEYKPENSVNFAINNDGDLHTYSFDLSANANWSDKVVQLRFYPTTGAKGHAWIDFIRVTENEGVSSEDFRWEFNPGGKGIVNNPVKRKELLDFCYVKGISTIFLNSQGVVCGTDIDKGFYTAFINEAHLKNIKVYGLQGRPWWAVPQSANVQGQMLSSEEGWDYVRAVEAYGQFDGIIDDTEPYAIDQTGWQSNIYMRVQWYIDWVQGCKNIIAARYPFISVIPFWFDGMTDTWNGDKTARPLNQYVSDIADSVCIMDYRDFAEGTNGMIDNAENEINYGPTWVAVEVQDNSPDPYADRVSFYEEGEAYMEAELAKFRNYFNTPNLLGIAVHYYEVYKKMKP